MTQLVMSSGNLNDEKPIGMAKPNFDEIGNKAKNIFDNTEKYGNKAADAID